MMKQPLTEYQEWEKWFNSCKTRDDYFRYYVNNSTIKENPFADKALKKLELFKVYEEELDSCSDSIKALENYVLKYIDSDNPYLQEAKDRIAELSKTNTPRWGVYSILLGLLCFLFAVACIFIILAVDGTSNSILALIGLLSMAGTGLFSFGGIWLIINGVIVIKNHYK